MSAEEPTTVTSPAAEPPAPAEAAPAESAPAPADDAPAPAPAPAAAEDKPASAKAASSPVKKVARPAKARSSMPAGGSKKAGGAGGEQKSFKPGDIVLGRLRGYPAWPARVADIDDLPPKVMAQRPGKSPQIYCVQFFPVGDYAWLQSKEINHLSAQEISAYIAEPHRKAAGGLMEAYQTAQDPTEWDEEQKQIRADREAADAQVDELEEEDEDAGGKAGAKRKRGAGEKKAAKKAKKAAKKNGVSAADAESEEDATAPKSKKAAKPPTKKAKPESQAVENQAPVDDDPLSSNPECVKVKDWRHKLQRAFLGKGLPTAEEMTSYDNLFKTIEEYKDMSIEALAYSKIGKVMKKIATLEGIPKNEELNITERASKLMNDWSKFVQGNGSTDAQANGDAKVETSAAAEPATNGTGEKMDEDTKAE